MFSAYVFDAYGTLFDVHAAIARHRAAAGPEAERFSEIWRTKQLEYTWTLTLAGRYVDFWTLTERALDYAFARVPSVDRALRPLLLDAYLKLSAFADARAVLIDLRARGARRALLQAAAGSLCARRRRLGRRTVRRRIRVIEPLGCDGRRVVRLQRILGQPGVYAGRVCGPCAAA